jgi:hypothetical protein
MDDSINNFNYVINRGERLGKWFEKKFGSTQCNKLIETQFNSVEGSEKYINDNSIKKCDEIVSAVIYELNKNYLV